MLPDRWRAYSGEPRVACLNAPDGAGCSLTQKTDSPIRGEKCLNAPDGAGCSLTGGKVKKGAADAFGLNAPDGAGCSLTPRRVERQLTCANVTPDRQWPNRGPPANEHEPSLGDFSLGTQGSPPTSESAPSLPDSNHFPTKSRCQHLRKCCADHPEGCKVSL